MTPPPDPNPPAPPTVAPANECICEDVRILGACPVHDPPTTDIASDALVAAWRYDLHRISDNERQETPVKEIRQLMNRIEADRVELEDEERINDALTAENDRLRARVAELEAALSELETRIFAIGSDSPICQLHRLKLSALVDFIRAALKPEPASR